MTEAEGQPKIYDRCEYLQITRLFAEKIPEAFRSCQELPELPGEEAKQEVFEAPSEVKTDVRPIIIPEFSEKQPLLEDIVAEVAKYDWDEAIALKVFIGESGLQEKVISPTNDIGVAQINLKVHYNLIPGNMRTEKIEWLQNYKNNIAFAYQIYRNAGNSFIPWVYYNNHIDEF